MAPKDRDGLRGRDKSRPYILVLGLIIPFFFVHSSAVFACPLCKEAISKMGEIWTGLGFNWSIYFMIAVPFLLVGTFAGALYLNYRKHRKG